MNLKTKDVQHTIEIRPNEFEVMSDANVKKNGDMAGFFHSLGCAIKGEEVDNEFLKANSKQ
ncbi:MULTISPECIES: hypothetical protein [Vibrio]|uniref:hypothetical protein n=1 Tax=Vibrio TaxID=662 RepID=UPI000841AB7D|nr:MULTISPECIES: hypothetical protein [Vibrio]ODM56999.1 hypothetical protein BC455_18065 [Vibrio harveyi]USD58658.1 hypothetical protein J4N44_27280 [Vibrio sp. SCSIO 43155]